MDRTKRRLSLIIKKFLLKKNKMSNRMFHVSGLRLRLTSLVTLLHRCHLEITSLFFSK